MSTLSESVDYAAPQYVNWSREKCATCYRVLPRYNLLGEEQRAWVDEEIGGVFCSRCYFNWKEHCATISDKLLEDIEPFVAQVVKALIRCGGLLDIDEDRRVHSVIGTLPLQEYERSLIWIKRRNEFLMAQGANPRCELCLRANTWTGSEHIPIAIQIHHRTYERTGCELDNDLAVLCNECHLVIHKPGLPAARGQFQRLLIDRDEKTVIDAIAALLPRQGWGPQ